MSHSHDHSANQNADRKLNSIDGAPEVSKVKLTPKELR